MALTHDDVREILRLIDASDVAELRVETGAFSLYVHRGADATSVPVEQDAPGASAPTAAPVEGAVTDELRTVSSPMLGTFYRAQAPGAEPYVNVGTPVEPHTIVCLIEVMKMMNSVPAGVAGTIVEVCAENAQLVEYGEPLFHVLADR